MDDRVEWVTRPTSSTQFYLFNLFADYIVPRGGCIWTNNLLYLLELLGVGERAARSSLSRMKRQGWFVSKRVGRQSQYALTERGRAILAEGDERIFEEPFTAWDGRWHLVVYSLPEKKRKKRNELRKKLIWLGFGNLAPGTWVTPHDRLNDLEMMLDALKIREFVTLFLADTDTSDEIVRQCWDLKALEADYVKYVSVHRPELERFRAGEESMTPAACFVRRFWLTYDFQRFPRKDPNLPVELLPENWIGFEARRILMEYRKLLSQGMGGFIDAVMNGELDRDGQSKRQK
jgi:phenylacetic acid degradation operon negative regulatory protein